MWSYIVIIVRKVAKYYFISIGGVHNYNQFSFGAFEDLQYYLIIVGNRFICNQLLKSN